MSEKQTFSSLRVWKSAIELAVKMYGVTQELPKEEQYAMSSQLKRVSTAVAAHLAEGYGRYYYKEKERLFNNAKGSIAEVQNFLYLAKDLHFLDEQRAIGLIEDYEKLSRGIGALISKVGQPKKDKSESVEETAHVAVN